MKRQNDPQGDSITFAPGPNAEQIRAQAMRVIRGRIPAEVRKELMAAVREGYLGRLAKDGLKPEIFYHPDHKDGAIECQNGEAAYSVNCIAKVMASPADVRAATSNAGGDVSEYTFDEHVAGGPR